MGIFDDLFDDPLGTIGSGFKDTAHFLTKYAPSIALGAGFGALAGLPAGGIGAIPGAILGGAGALGASYAGPKVAKALPKGTPDWVRTGAEFGVYGLTAPLGFGAAGAGGLGARVFSRMGFPTALKIAGLSGVGAAGGQEFAKVLGVPEGIGKLAGGLAAPVGLPFGWRATRSALASSLLDPEARVAPAIARALNIEAPAPRHASEAVAKVAGRQHSLEVALGEQADHVRHAVNWSSLVPAKPTGALAESSLPVAVRKDVIGPGTYRGGVEITDPSGVRMLGPGEAPAEGEQLMYHVPRLADEEWIARTGYTRTDAMRLARGQPVGSERELMTTPYKRDRLALPALNNRLVKARATEDSLLPTDISNTHEVEATALEAAWGTPARAADMPKASAVTAAMNKLTGAGYDVGDVQASLDDFTAIARSDYAKGADGLDEYLGDKEEAWGAITEAMHSLDAPENTAIVPNIVRVAVKSDATRPAEEGLAAARGAVQVKDPAGIRVLKPGEVPAEGEQLLFHGTAGDLKGALKKDAYLTPSESDAGVYANTSVKLADNTRRLATLNRQNVERLFTDRLGLPQGSEIPAAVEDQINLLRQKHAPGIAQLGAEPVPTQEQMRVLYRQTQAYESGMAVESMQKVRKSFEASRRMGPLIDLLGNESFLPGRGLPHGSVANAARLAAGIRDTTQLIENRPSGFTAAREGVESMADYLNYANTITGSKETPADILAAVGPFFESPRGTPHVFDPVTGYAQPKLIAGPIQLGPEGLTIPVRDPFVSIADAEHVPLGSLVMRYSQDQLEARAEEWAKAATRMRDAATSSQELAAVEQTIKGVKAPEAARGEQYFRNQAQYDNAVRHALNRGVEPPPPGSPILENNLQSLQQQLHDLFVPEENTVSSMYPGVAEQRARGQLKWAMMSPKGGLTQPEVVSYMESRQWTQQPMLERLREYTTLDDPELIDPMRPIYDLYGKSEDDLVSNVVFNEPSGLFGSVRQFLAHAFTGRVVTHPIPKALLAGHFPMLYDQANRVGAMRMPLLTAIQEEAARLQSAPVSVRQQVGAAVSAAATTGATSPLAALSAARRQIHPLARGADELVALQRAHFSAGAAAASQRLSPMMAKLEQVRTLYGDDKYAEAADLLFANNPVAFIEYPEAFPRLANEPTLQQLGGAWRFYTAADAHIDTVAGVSALSQAQKFSMMTAQKYRQYLNQDVISAKNANMGDLILEVLKIPGAANQPLAKLLTTGQHAALAGPMASANARVISNTVDQLKKITAIDPATGSPFVLGPKDITFRGGDWHINSLNKFPPEMQESLKGMQDILSGAYGGLAGITRLSQTLAMGVLAADLSLVGIHGFKFAAQGLLSGHPVQAVEALNRGLTHIMTDHGFYSWMKTNDEEISYYTQHGLTGGLRGAIAGPDITRMPLESVPLLGKLVTGIREFSDIMYNRMLFYWKTEAVRMNLEFAKNMRELTSDLSERIVTGAPTQKAIETQLGGHAAYRLTDDEALVQAVVNQVNNSLGGVDLRAQGVGVMRQAIEQILAIVPGFTRGQIGQWGAMITKPNTVEGWLAASMAGREAMFGASIALGMSRMLGTETLINWDKPDKADWLAIHLPGGGYISTMSTMAIPRLLSRVVDQTAQGMVGLDNGQGGGFDYSGALEAFAHGRLSPAAGALYDAFVNKDFLGRSYSGYDTPLGHVPGVVDRWASVLERATLPIVIQQTIDDVKEGLRGSGVDMREIALDTGANILGKSYVPDSPVKTLNTMAQQAVGTDWNLLTDAQQYQLRQQNPAVAAADAEFKFYMSRRATSEQAHVDAAYKDFKTMSDHIWTDPVMIKNMTSSQQQDNQLLAAGSMTGDDWRERYHHRQDAVAQSYSDLQARLAYEGIDPEKQKQARLARLAAAHNPDDAAWLLQIGKSEYQGVPLQTIGHTVSTPTGDVTVGITDWQRFADDRATVLNQYPLAIQNAIKAASPDTSDGVVAYRQAAEWQKAIEALPRYRGLSADQGDKVDAMRSVISAVRQQIAVSLNLQPGQAAPPQVAGIVKQLAVQEMQKNNLLIDDKDISLLTIAMAMDGDAKLSNAMMNPEQIAMVLNHPEAVVFYPYLQYRIPKVLRSRLPPQVQPLAKLEGQLALA